MTSEHPDVLVIGGGVVGVCCAYYAAKAGLRVTLLEKEELASGCSHGNAGRIVSSPSVHLAAPGVIAQGLRWLLDPESPLYIKPRLDLELFRWLWRFRAAAREVPMRRVIPLLRDLQRASLTLFAELLAGEEAKCDFGQRGYMRLYRTESGFQKALQEKALLEEFGIQAEALDMPAALAKEPALSPQIHGALFFSEDAFVDVVSFTQELARRSATSGAVFRTGLAAEAFQLVGERIVAVYAGKEAFQPVHIVLAAGSWSPALGKLLQLRLPIQPAKGYSVTLEQPANGPRLPLMCSEAKVAVTPFTDRLRLAGTLELSGFNWRINRRRVQAIMRAKELYLREMGELRILETWAGLRPATPDSLPIIGRPRSIKNLVLATGHGMLGVSLAPITGLLVAQLLAGDKPDIELTQLQPDRF